MTTPAFLSIGSIVILLALMALHAAGAYYFWQRLAAGHNGVTFALMVQMLSIGQLLTVQAGVVLLAALQSPDYWQLVQVVVLVSRLLVLFSTVYLVSIAKIEAHKPLKRQTWTRERLYKTIRGDE
jgi:hypothetical protein